MTSLDWGLKQPLYEASLIGTKYDPQNRQASAAADEERPSMDNIQRLRSGLDSSQSTGACANFREGSGGSAQRVARVGGAGASGGDGSA